MIHLSVHTDGDNCWPDLVKGEALFGRIVSIARLPHGTEGDKSTVTVRVELPNGTTILAETTLALLEMAMAAFKGAELRDAKG